MDKDNFERLVSSGASVETIVQELKGVGYAGLVSWEPLHMAARAGRADLIEPLAAIGVDVNAPARMAKWRPVHTAIEHGRIDAVRELMRCGADVDAASESGMTPLHLAVDIGLDGDDEMSLEAVQLLLEFGADPGKVDHEGRSALDWCGTELMNVRRVLEQARVER